MSSESFQQIFGRIMVAHIIEGLSSMFGRATPQLVDLEMGPGVCIQPGPIISPNQQTEAVESSLNGAAQPEVPGSSWGRLEHFTFAWYTVVMSTFGVSLTMAVTLKFEPFATGSGWLNPVIKFTGLSLFFLAMVAFIFITITLLIRFLRYPKTFIPAFTRPKEDIFTATFFLSLAAMASSGVEYGRLVLPSDIQTGLASFLHVAFWVYLAVTFLSSLAQYQCLFTAEKGLRFVPKELSPGWIMPIFPVMLSGTFAAACVPGLKADQALRVLSAGLVAQGLGMMVAVFFYGAYLTRLVLLGLPHHRQAMFIAVGPPSFTCLALIGLGGEVPRILAELGGGHIYGGIERGFMGLVLTSSELQVLAAGVKLLAVYASLFLWGLSFWFLGISLVALYPELPEKEFRLSWWSFVFPNVGFVLSTLKMGAALGSDGLSWFRVAMSGLLFLVWLFVFYRCIRGVVKREIVWEGRDEDHVEQPAAPTPQT